ncbi:MAG TPA: transketolase, partial [Candidatus Aerophobetes bacterium]|nr:transketolase [Candidatus Aerophobetes bacterium]
MRVKIEDIKKLEEIARRLRVKVVKMIGKSGFGHAGGSMSIAELLTCLYFYEMRYDPKNPAWEERDRFVLSKGHAAPIFYAVLSEAGFIPEDILLTIHHPDSPLQCHPDMRLCPGVEVSTGALGQGLSIAVGMALGAKMRKKSFRVYTLMGDGEIQEGQVWEAAMSASKFKLDNLVGIVDYNKLELSGRVEEVMPLEPLYEKWISFGWHVIEINGHSFTQIMNALNMAKNI